MKHDNCPNCRSTHLGDSWYGPRLLRQHCNNCGWQGEKRVPEQKPIETKKVVTVGQFGGFEYTVFDKYGHNLIFSRTYSTEAEAEENLKADLERGKKDEHAGPYTAVLWPRNVEIHGKLFKGDDGHG